MAEDEINIVGVGCRIPGTSKLFQFLIYGENHDIDIPKTSWNNDVLYAKDLTAPGKMYVKEAGLPKSNDTWENRPFRMSDVETSRIDRQCVQRCNDILDLVPMELEDGGDCNMEICGGVSSMISPDTFPANCEACMMSKKEQWRPFRETAYGYARENGCGIIILKGPNEISGDANRMRALVKTGCNQDGSTEKIREAPYGEVHLQLFKRTYGANYSNPFDTRYIGAHDTGTLQEYPTHSNAEGERHTCLNSFGSGAFNTHAVIPRGETTACIMNEDTDNVVFQIFIFGMNEESIRLNISQFQSDLEESMQSIWTDTDLKLGDALILINILTSSIKRVINIMIIKGNTHSDVFEEIFLRMLQSLKSKLSTFQELQDYQMNLPHETNFIITISVLGNSKCKRLSFQNLRKIISLIINLLDNIWISQIHVFPGVSFTLNSIVHVCSISRLPKAMSAIRKCVQHNGSYTAANEIENSFLLRLPMKSVKTKEVIQKGSLKRLCDKTRFKPYYKKCTKNIQFHTRKQNRLFIHGKI